MEVELPFLSGYLVVPTQTGFPLHRISKKKSCKKYCLLFKSSRYGIERLEICEAKDDKNPKIITLENCVKITQESCPANLIHIVKKSGTLTLNALNKESLKEWVNALQTVAFSNKNDTVLSQSAIEEDNDLYCSSYGDGLFIVTLIPSEASIRCKITPKVYMLHLTATELQLKSTSDLSNIISNWPYRFIRKYGYRNGKFTFEAGRKCHTGEGVFTLDHTNPQEVFRCMSGKMKSMKKMIACDSVKVDNCENQLRVAATMEAGSRSPLPPSPSNQNAMEFEVNSIQSSFSFRNIMPICESNCSSGIIVTQKIMPNKPPRKINAIDKSSFHSSQFLHKKQLPNENCIKYKTFGDVSISSSSDPNKGVGSSVILKPSSPDLHQNFQKIVNCVAPQLPARNDLQYERNYESIETITDAWKTMGINDVKHNEQFTFTDLNNPKNSSVAKIIDIDIGECSKSPINIRPDLSYDRLDFLSANHKTSNGYKSIVTVAPLSSKNIEYKISQNEYELINLPKNDKIPQTDESCDMYGVLRHSQILIPVDKESENIENISKTITIDIDKNIAVIKHANSDILIGDDNDSDLNYAVVSKAK